VTRSFHDRLTAKLAAGLVPKGVNRELASAAQKRLERLDRARILADLTAYPGDRLEKLKGNRAGQHSIRVNDQWRICFRWRDGDAERVEFCDYH
jgi:proteic killer suppression protein